VRDRQSHLDRYDAVTIIFYWATVVLVLSLFASAMAWSHAPRDWGARWLTSGHGSQGIALAAALSAAWSGG